MQSKGSILVKVPVAYSAGVFCGNGRTGEMIVAFGDYILGVCVQKWPPHFWLHLCDQRKSHGNQKKVKTTNIEPKGCQSEPKGSQREPRNLLKYHLRNRIKNVTKKRSVP